ncbi:MAG: glycosyltransferase [bacterium]
MRLSIVIPAHNEERRIGPMLEDYLPYFSSRYGADVEFLVVINGSTDRTDDVVAEYAARYPCLKAIIEPDPIGKGGALMVGFRQARGALIGFVDADGATPPEAFQDLVGKRGNSGCIIASRWARGANVMPRQTLGRRIASRMFNLMTRTLFGLRLTDTQCGAKLMTREAIHAILPHLGITQWAFDVDLLFQLRRAGYVITEIPTTWHDVEGSKIQVGKASTEMVLALARLRLIYSPFSWVVDIYNRFLGPWIHPVGTVRDHLLTHSLVLFVGAQFANICNLLFQLLMVRTIENVEYGVMSAMLGGMMMLGIPLTALTGAVTHFTSEYEAAGKRDKIKAMMLAFGRDLQLPVLLVALATVVFGQELMVTFKMSSPWPIYVAMGTIAVMVLGAVPGGILLGMQAFEWSAMIGNSWTGIRLVLGVGVVVLGLGAVGALTAHMLSLMVSLLISVKVCLGMLGGERVKAERPAGIYSYMSGFLLSALHYGVLVSADVLLVKYYFPSEEAGIFAKAAMVARIVFFFPGPVAQAMFPKVTSTGEASVASRRTLRKAMVVTGILIALPSAVFLVFPELMLRLIAHGVQPGQVGILRGMVLALAPLSFVALVMNYELAQRRFKIMIPLCLCAAGYIVGARLWHETPQQIVWALGIASVSALVLSLAYMEISGQRRKTRPC